MAENHAYGVANQLLEYDRPVSRRFEKLLEDDLSGRVDVPLEHGCTKAPGGTDDDGVGESGFGVDREHDARTGQIRTNHLLDPDRKGNVEMNQAFRFTVSDRPVCEQRGATAPARILKRELPFHVRSEEHTSELQSLMRLTYAASRLKTHTNYHL